MILKLKQNGMSANLLKISEDFPSNRYQVVALNGQDSEWASVNDGVPQGSFIALFNDYQLICHQILDFLQMTRFFFQLFVIEIQR